MYAAVPRIRPSPVAGRSRHGRRVRALTRCIRELREAEIEHLDAAVVLTLSDHDVAGLQVAVRDAFLVGGRDGIGHGNRNRQDLVESQAAFRNHFGEGPSFDQLHREERHAVDGLDRMNRDDVRMVERGDGPGLALEALAAFGIECRRVRQHLERDEPVEPRVPRFVDLAHTPAAERGDDLVRPETHACGERHSRRSGRL